MNQNLSRQEYELVCVWIFWGGHGGREDKSDDSVGKDTTLPGGLSSVAGTRMVERKNKFHKIIHRIWSSKNSLPGVFSSTMWLPENEPPGCWVCLQVPLSKEPSCFPKCVTPKSRFIPLGKWILSLDTLLPDNKTNAGKNGERQHLLDSPWNHRRPVSFWSHSGMEHSSWPW